MLQIKDESNEPTSQTQTTAEALFRAQAQANASIDRDVLKGVMDAYIASLKSNCRICGKEFIKK